MISGIPSLLAVLCAQIIVYLLPPLVVARRLANNSSWIIIGWWALFLGISSQAILGFIWSHLARHSSVIEAMVWLASWLVATTLCLALKSRRANISKEFQPGLKESLILCSIIASGFLLRSLHPLQYWALGQSDAYSHLQFIQEVIKKGCLDNRLYPSGHSWVMGLPTMIFHIDPYFMARYGGAFFGLCLILAVYVLVRTNAHTPTPALIAAFLVSCFPALNILHKTSVGVFANQMGLFLVPSLLTLFLLWRNTSFRWGAPFIGCSVGLTAMIACTPIMLIHVLMLGVLERLTWCFIDGGKTIRSIPLLALTLVPAALLITFHLGQANSRALESAIHIVAPSARSESSSIRDTLAPGKDTIAHQHSREIKSQNALYDFFSIKRYGFHDWFLNLGGGGILCVFMICFIYGWLGRSPLLILTGLWGGLTSIQVLTGWLQFSMYQREGWSLIIATIVLTSVIGGILWDNITRWVLGRVVIILALMMSLVVAFLNPPGHVYFTSTAENDIVYWIKLISYHCRPSGLWPPMKPNNQFQKDILNSIDPRYSPVLVTRQMAGWSSGQGELAFVIGRGIPTLVFELARAKEPLLDPRRQYIFLVETGKVMESRPSSISFIMQIIQPEMVRSFARVLANESQYVNEMETFIAENSKRQWLISRTQLSAHLNVVILTPP